MQSRGDACRARVLMKLSSDVRRCREELPEAARRRLPRLITAARRQAAHSTVEPWAETTHGGNEDRVGAACRLTGYVLLRK